jgi:hypothetical protein
MPRHLLAKELPLTIVRRALVAAAASSTALAGVAVIGLTTAQAATATPTSLSISAPRQVTYGNSARVTGDLTNTITHKGLSGLSVQLRERQAGTTKWTVVGTAVTSSTGSVSLSTSPLKRTEQVQLVHPKTATTQATASSVKTIKIAYAVTATLSKDTVTVTVAPRAVGQIVKLQKLGKAGWATVQTKKLGAGSSTTFTIKPPKAKGTYRYRVVKPASSGFLQGISATLILVV